MKSCSVCQGKIVPIGSAEIDIGSDIVIANYDWYQCEDCNVQIGRPRWTPPPNEYDEKREKIKALPRIKEKTPGVTK